MAFQKHRKALLNALNGKEVLIETTPQEGLSLMGVEGSSHPLFTFFDEDLPPEGAIHTRPLQITIECMGAKVPMVLIDIGSTLNVCPFRTALTVGLDMKTIIPSPLTIRVYDWANGSHRRFSCHGHHLELQPSLGKGLTSPK